MAYGLGGSWRPSLSVFDRHRKADAAAFASAQSTANREGKYAAKQTNGSRRPTWHVLVKSLDVRAGDGGYLLAAEQRLYVARYIGRLARRSKADFHT